MAVKGRLMSACAVVRAVRCGAARCCAVGGRRSVGCNAVPGAMQGFQAIEPVPEHSDGEQHRKAYC